MHEVICVKVMIRFCHLIKINKLFHKNPVFEAVYSKVIISHAQNSEIVYLFIEEYKRKYNTLLVVFYWSTIAYDHKVYELHVKW